MPGPHANLQLRRLIVERQAAPDILLSGLVTPEDVTILFEMYVLSFPWSATLQAARLTSTYVSRPRLCSLF